MSDEDAPKQSQNGGGAGGKGARRFPSELLTAAQMRAVEASAIASGAVTGLGLMERAGAGVVEAVFEEWPELASAPKVVPGQPPAPRRAVVLCGPGNNGGDGFVVARLLKGLGWQVEVFLYGDPERLPPDARVNHGRWGGEVHDFFAPWPDSLASIPAEGGGVLVDALFGTGLTRGLETAARQRLGDFRAQVPLCFLHQVAVDVPSGLDADSGRYLLGADGLSSAWTTDLCVTFHRPRLGHYIAGAGIRRLVVKDIGLDQGRAELGRSRIDAALSGLAEIMAAGPEALRAVLAKEVSVACPPSPALLVKGPAGDLSKAGGHKFSHGHAVVVSGPEGACGAARMTSRAALRVGAGLVTLACPPEAMAENAARLDAVMLKTVADPEALSALLSDPRINALCLGPGLGLDSRAAGVVRAALLASRSREVAKVGPGTAGGAGQGAEPRGIPRATQEEAVAPDAGAVREDHAASRALVLDADALTLIARDPTLFALLHEGCILTPHGGEFARLFPDLAARQAAPALKGPSYSKVDATREAAARAGCTVLFKGPDTVIASPDGTCAIHAAVYDRAAPWLATAGSGDVLAGLITGLLARGFTPQQAAETGAWLHVEAARAFGPGLIAEDLPDMIPRVFRDLGL